MLKRIVAIIIIISIIFCMESTFLSIYSKDNYDVIPEIEAFSLVQKAVSVFYEVLNGVSGYGDSRDDKQLIGDFPRAPYHIIDPAKINGGSLDGFLDYLKTIYKDTLAEKYYSSGYLFNEFPLFVTDNEGDTFMSWNFPMDPRIDIESLNASDLEIIESKSDNAIARIHVLVNIGNLIDGFSFVDAWVECKFENTPSGWRISDCAFFDMLNSHESDFEWTPVNSPSTGDENVSRVWWLAGVSLAALVPAALLVQRRRRRED